MLTNRLKMDRYLRSTVVLAIDTVVSLIASICVLLFCHIISRGPGLNPNFLSIWLLTAFFGSGIAFYATRVYRSVIRYSTLREIGQICIAVIAKEIILGFCSWLLDSSYLSGATLFTLTVMDFLVTFSALLLIRVAMVAAYRLINRYMQNASSVARVLVYGVGDKSAAVVTRLQKSSHYEVVGFIIHGHGSEGNLLLGLPISRFSSAADVMALKRRLNLDGILFAYHQDAREEQDRLIEFARKAGLKLFISPTIDEMPDGKLLSTGIRKIKIEDLLGRSEIKISMDEIRNNFNGKRILVTGAAGSIGSELCRQLATLGVSELIMFDNAETPLHNVRLEFGDNYPDLNFTPVIGDVRQTERLDYVFRKFRPQVVFHAAAYKHVPLMEENPCEAVLVNVVGSRNVAEKCVEYGTERMVMVSTDKAVNPTNIMGCTKRLAEIYVQSLGLAIERGEVKGQTTFVTTRFGNVLGSNGSVIPRFTEQIEKGGPVTVTDPEIRRFFMTIPEACRLVMEAATMANGTQIFVFDMGTPIKIADLARRMIHLAGYEVDRDIKIEYTGLRPGEKLYEEVLATKENTIPTDHDRIFKAKVREYGYADAANVTRQLEQLSRSVTIPEMVMLMKRTVPEFKSKHSIFEKYDKN